MQIPKLKRIKVSTITELETWLTKSRSQPQDVMIMTSRKLASLTYVSSADVRDTATRHGWQTGQSYTLNGGLAGHVLHHP